MENRRMPKRKRIAWAYVGLVYKHPFINLGVDTLNRLGHTVSIYSRENVVFLPGFLKLQGSRFHSFFKRWRRTHLLWNERVWTLVVLPKIIRSRPEIIICTMPQALLVGWIIKKFFGCRLVYYPFELYGEQVFQSIKFWEKIERWMLRKGNLDALITQNEKRADVFRRDRRASVEPCIVHNYKPSENVHPTRKLRTLLNLPADIQIVLYEGVFKPGRWLDRLVHSVAFLPENVRLVMMGEKLAWWQKIIAPLVADPEIGRKVIHTPYIPQHELLEYVADADVGIIIYDNSALNNLFCEPGKLSDYVIAGIPVVAPDFPTIGPVIRRYGIGEVFSNGSPAEIAGAIQKVVERPRQSWKTALDVARRDLIWETQVDNFLQGVFGENA